MINLEKMNDVVSGLENVANNLNSISEMTKVFDSYLVDNKEILNTVKDYDKRTYDLKMQIDSLIENFNKINETYKLEKESYDMTTSKLEEFSLNVKSLVQNTENSINSLNSDVISKLEEYFVLVKEYSSKAETLNEHVVSLIDKLEEIRKDYHKVSSSFELVEIDLKQFSSRLDLQKIENAQQINEFEGKIKNLEDKLEKNYERLLKDNLILKVSLIVLAVLVVVFGLF